MSNSVRPKSNFNYGGPGYLSRIQPPAGSCWSRLDFKDIAQQRIEVRHSAGAHELGWVIRDKAGEPNVLFTLYQQTHDGFIAVRTKAIPARPVFSVTNEMIEVFGAGTRTMAEPASPLFARCALTMPDLKEFQDDIEDMTLFMGDEMLQWFRNDIHFRALAKKVYTAVSGDVSQWLSRPQTRLPPRPAQPGN